MNGELARRRPAETVHRIEGVTLPRTETLERSSLKEVKTELRKMARRGEIGATYKLKATDRGWALAYMRIKEPRRLVWRKLALAMPGVGLLVWAVATYWVVLLAVLLAGTVVTVGIIWLISRARGSNVTVVQNVLIKR